MAQARSKAGGSKKAASSNLVAIKERLRAGKVTRADVKELEKIVAQVERASKALRAAIVE